MMYLMKLKHGDKFGQRSSSTWRLLFVFALMPWLRKYRITDDVSPSDDDKMKIEEALELVKAKYIHDDELMHRISIIENSQQLQALMVDRIGDNVDDALSEDDSSYMSAEDDLSFDDPFDDQNIEAVKPVPSWEKKSFSPSSSVRFNL